MGSHLAAFIVQRRYDGIELRIYGFGAGNGRFQQFGGRCFAPAHEVGKGCSIVLDVFSKGQGVGGCVHTCWQMESGKVETFA